MLPSPLAVLGRKNEEEEAAHVQECDGVREEDAMGWGGEDAMGLVLGRVPKRGLNTHMWDHDLEERRGDNGNGYTDWGVGAATGDGGGEGGGGSP